MQWWDEEMIVKTVNRQFICAQLREDETFKIDQAPFSGGGLTDDTYLDWIVGRARRLFLILVDVGVPDQIFGVIDDSWDDDDLPIPQDEIDRLRLTPERNPKLEKRFFQRQFIYMLRGIEQGGHVLYDDHEIIPLEIIEKRPARVVQNSFIDKVYLPLKPDSIFLRRRVPLCDAQSNITPEDFLAGIAQMKSVVHKHVESYWASYVQNGVGYVLLAPIPDGTLKSIMTVIPSSLKILDKRDRRVLFLNWLNCLADSLAFLHSQGQPHRSIKPSNILINNDHEIFLSECSPFTEIGETVGFDKELYDYAAPEQWSRSASISHQITRSSTASSISSMRPATMPPTFPGDNASIYTTSTSSNSTSSPSISGTSTMGRPDPFSTDVFALGCIFLEILTVLLKRTSRSFNSHRSAKNRQAGRGGGLPDASFHKNIGQIQSWIQTLDKDASKKDDKLLKGVREILVLVSTMLNVEPSIRPSAGAVSNWLGDILTRACDIQDLCCPAYDSQWDITSGIAALTIGIASPKPTPASVSPDIRKSSSMNWPLPDTQTGIFPMGSRASTRSSSIAQSDSFTSLASRQLTPSTSVSALSAKTTSSSLDGKAARPRRFASGGGRTAPPKSALKAWSAPVSAEKPEKASSEESCRSVGVPDRPYGVEKKKDDYNYDSDDGNGDGDKSMWNLRLHDYETGTVRAVGWEELG